MMKFPKKFPQIEIVLNDYVLVSQRTNNTIDNIDAEIQINITLQQMRNRLSSLRKLKPDIDTTLTTQQKDTELDAYNASVARYELAYRALIETLGDGASPRNSIVMQSLYSSQFLDYALR